MNHQREYEQECEQRHQRATWIKKKPKSPHDVFPYVSIDMTELATGVTLSFSHA
jgi:hypothetical protein